MKKLIELNRKFWAGYEKMVQFVAMVLAIILCAVLEMCGIDTGAADDDFFNK